MCCVFRCVMHGLLLTAPSSALHAQQYPARPIRIVVGFAAGGPTDVAGRLVSQKFTEKWGQPVIVASRPAPAAISQRNL